MEEDIPLEWFRRHPYVALWRESSSNSYGPTVSKLNQILKSCPEHRVTYGRVDKIVSKYLELLGRKFRKYCKNKKIVPIDAVRKKLQLTPVELNYLMLDTKSK